MRKAVVLGVSKQTEKRTFGNPAREVEQIKVVLGREDDAFDGYVAVDAAYIDKRDNRAKSLGFMSFDIARLNGYVPQLGDLVGFEYNEYGSIVSLKKLDA